MFFKKFSQYSAKFPLLIITLSVLGLAGCDDAYDDHYHDDYYGDSHHHDSYYEHTDHHHHDDVWYGGVIDIYSLALKDSAGFSTDSRYGPYTPEVIVKRNPGEDIFDIYWGVNHSEHYQANIYVNDKRSLAGAISLMSKECELGTSCDDEGAAVCYYSTNHIQCSASAFFNQDVYIGNLLRYDPQQLYIVLETCDLDWGECDIAYQELFVY